MHASWVVSCNQPVCFMSLVIHQNITNYSATLVKGILMEGPQKKASMRNLRGSLKKKSEYHGAKGSDAVTKIKYRQKDKW